LRNHISMIQESLGLRNHMSMIQDGVRLRNQNGKKNWIRRRDYYLEDPWKWVLHDSPWKDGNRNQAHQ
jgi:hypothetical protein